MDNLIRADEKVYDANVRLTSLRKLRDELVSKLASEIVRLRRLVLSLYKDPDLQTLGLFSPRVRVPDPLMRQAGTIDRTFSGDEWETLVGEPAHEDETLDPQSPVVLRPKQVSAELHSTIEEIEDAQRALDEAIIEKDTLKEEHGELFVYTARTFESNCRLAGLPRLAAKVRPSESQPGRRAEEEGEDPDAPDSGPPLDTTSPLDDLPADTDPTP